MLLTFLQRLMRALGRRSTPRAMVKKDEPVLVSRSCVARGGARKTGALRSPRQRTNVMVRHVLFHGDP
jgi:hypothetical protein